MTKYKIEIKKTIYVESEKDVGTELSKLSDADKIIRIQKCPEILEE